MNEYSIFFVKSILLGIGLAMDAFSISLANGLNEPNMKKNKMLLIAGVFAFFQALMPILGWICVHTIAEYFEVFEKMIPWIALILLGYIGAKMIIDGIKNNQSEIVGVGLYALFVQGIATSIDALSVGFAIEEYSAIKAMVSAAIISVITFDICFFGLIIGKKFGTKFSDKTSVLGGTILAVIGICIFIRRIL
ncbi:MAG: manganese efflux pump [Eubacteriales bacterium]|nr:manganese efflux pump [Eubacteriales bacterium]